MTAPMTPGRRDAPVRGVLLMVLASASFAAMNAFSGGLTRSGIPWTLVSFTRAIVGLAVTFAVARSRGASLAIKKPRTMWTRSLSGTTGMLCTFYALAHLPLSDATALLNTTPLWLALLAWVTLREAPGVAVVAALAIGSAGIAIVERPNLAVGEIAGLVALSTGATGALAMVSLRRLGDETPEAVVVHFSAVAAAVTGTATAIDLFHRGALPHFDGRIIAALVATGLCATSGQLLMTRAYALDRAARVGAAQWLQVVFALLIDRIALGRTPPVSTLGGIACIVAAGVLLVFDARRDHLAATAATRRA